MKFKLKLFLFCFSLFMSHFVESQNDSIKLIDYPIEEEDNSYKYTRFKFGGQLFNEVLLSDNAIFADNKKNLYDNYLDYLRVNEPEILNQNPRSYLELNNSKVLGNLFFGYNFNYYNSLYLFLQFSYRYNSLHFYGQEYGNSASTDFGDLCINFTYFRHFYLSKKFRLKVGGGIGLISSDVNYLNSIYQLSSNSVDSFQGKNAIFFDNNNSVFTTEELFRNAYDVSLNPRIQLDFTRKDKSYFSLIGGMNIIPFDYIGVRAEIVDAKTNKVINRKDYRFKNTSVFFGIGYTIGWNKQ